jgi:3-oxoadipate enol-lactonase
MLLTSRFEAPGCALAYEDRPGVEPAAVFLHGAGTDHTTFAEQADALAAAARRTVLLDLRAHGLSRPNTTPPTAARLLDDVERLIAHCGLVRPVLVGHSLGGNLAQELVRRAPGAYSGLMVLDATWNTGPLGCGERLLLHLAAPGLALIPARALPGLMARGSAVTGLARADAVRAFSQVPKREFLEIWRAAVSLLRSDPGYRTPVPLCLLRGGADLTGNIRTAMPAWAAAEGVAEHVIPGAGHLVSQDAPDAVTAVLLAFFATLDLDG